MGKRTLLALSRITALLARKSTLALLCSIFLLTTFMIVQRSGVVDMKKRYDMQRPGFAVEESIIHNEHLKKNETPWLEFTPEEKESKWKKCKRLISGEERVNRTFITRNDSEILNAYKLNENCDQVLQTRFPHPRVTKEEANLPIAYGLTIYKSASLFERLLRPIYMPHNVYCIHIDKKSPEVFYRAIQAIIRCLPNVFIAANRVDVVWGHFSLVQAQLECMKELLESSVKWKYYISLVGQDFPLYENKEIVVALKRLNNTNSMESFPLPKHNEDRTKSVFILQNGGIRKTDKIKSPPPQNISVYKGETHIVVIRDFVGFVLYSKIGKDFTEFLKDAYVPDESIYSTLQQHPLAPGGIRGKQPEHIARALRWAGGKVCHGQWIRALCWLSIKDLQWALRMKHKLFVHKIPFDSNDHIIECLLVVRQGRKYYSDVWNADLTVSQN